MRARLATPSHSLLNDPNCGRAHPASTRTAVYGKVSDCRAMRNPAISGDLVVGHLQMRYELGSRPALLLQWNFDNQSAHDIVQLEIMLGAFRMQIMAPNAGLIDGAIGIDCLKIASIAP